MNVYIHGYMHAEIHTYVYIYINMFDFNHSKSTLDIFLELIMSPGKTVLSLSFQWLSYLFNCHS